MNDEHLRMSDAEREQAAAELGEHYAQGRLTTEEHSERLDRIWAARTRAELAPVFSDLPGRFGPQPAAPLTYGPPARGYAAPARRRGLPGPLMVILAVLVIVTVLTPPAADPPRTAWCGGSSRGATAAGRARAPRTQRW